MILFGSSLRCVCDRIFFVEDNQSFFRNIIFFLGNKILCFRNIDLCFGNIIFFFYYKIMCFGNKNLFVGDINFFFGNKIIFWRNPSTSVCDSRQ